MKKPENRELIIVSGSGDSLDFQPIQWNRQAAHPHNPHPQIFPYIWQNLYLNYDD